MNIHLDYSFSTNEFLEMVKSVGWKTYSKLQVEKAGFKCNPNKITGMYLWIKK